MLNQIGTEKASLIFKKFLDLPLDNKNKTL